MLAGALWLPACPAAGPSPSPRGERGKPRLFPPPYAPIALVSGL